MVIDPLQKSLGGFVFLFQGKLEGALTGIPYRSFRLNTDLHSSLNPVIYVGTGQHQFPVTFRNTSHLRVLRERLSRSLSGITEQLNSEEMLAAQTAMDEALRLLNKLNFKTLPWAGFTEEGIAVAQWRRKDHGLIMLFTGDGEFTFSECKLPGSYTDSLSSYRIRECVPSRVVNAMLDHNF